jgi:hypothetical protein
MALCAAVHHPSLLSYVTLVLQQPCAPPLNTAHTHAWLTRPWGTRSLLKRASLTPRGSYLDDEGFDNPVGGTLANDTTLVEHPPRHSRP